MVMRDALYSINIDCWLYVFATKVQQVYGSNPCGGNAYLYKKSSGYMCCALIYTKPENEWVEVAASRCFTKRQVPRNIRKHLECGYDVLDVSYLLRRNISKYNSNGDDNMKFNLFKLAQVAQTAIDVADNVNATYNVPHADDDDLSTYAQDTSMTGTERTLSMVRAAVNQDWFDLAKLGFDALVNLVSQEPLSYENYLAAISQYIDVKIQQFSQDEELRFVGGECSIVVERHEQAVKTTAQMYFKNTNGKWVVKEMNGNTSFNCFAAETLDGELTDIMNSGGVKFPITKPE